MQGYLYYGRYSKSDLQKCWNSGKFLYYRLSDKSHPDKWWTSGSLKTTGKYKHFIPIPVSAANGLKIHKKAYERYYNPGKYSLAKRQCDNFVDDAVSAGGVSYDVKNSPWLTFKDQVNSKGRKYYNVGASIPLKFTLKATRYTTKAITTYSKITSDYRSVNTKKSSLAKNAKISVDYKYFNMKSLSSQFVKTNKGYFSASYCKMSK